MKPGTWYHFKQWLADEIAESTVLYWLLPHRVRYWASLTRIRRWIKEMP